MRRMPVLSAIAVSCCVIVLLMLTPALADVEWETTKKLDLDVSPLGSVLSADGQTLFILSPGEIVVFSMRQNKVTHRIPVDKAFDAITLSPKANALIVTSSKEKTLEIIQLEFIQEINIAGLPVKGPVNAPVTIAVFSDYQ